MPLIQVHPPTFSAAGLDRVSFSTQHALKAATHPHPRSDRAEGVFGSFAAVPFSFFRVVPCPDLYCYALFCSAMPFLFKSLYCAVLYCCAMPCDVVL